nr:translation initiation factor IF-2-like [Aegilops tauschii subsp. strangulata]
MTPQPCAGDAPSPASARFRWRPACPCAAEWLLLCPRPYVRAFAAAPPVSACRQADAAVPGAFVRLHALHLRLTTCTAPAPTAPCLRGSTSTRTWPPPRACHFVAMRCRLPRILADSCASGSPASPPPGHVVRARPASAPRARLPRVGSGPRTRRLAAPAGGRLPPTSRPAARAPRWLLASRAGSGLRSAGCWPPASGPAPAPAGLPLQPVAGFRPLGGLPA